MASLSFARRAISHHDTSIVGGLYAQESLVFKGKIARIWCLFAVMCSPLSIRLSFTVNKIQPRANDDGDADDGCVFWDVMKYHITQK